MAVKTLTLVVYGPDRELWRSGPLRLSLTRIDSHGLSRVHAGAFRGPVVEVRADLAFDAGQTYGARVAANGHRPAWQLFDRGAFLRPEGPAHVERAEVILRLMLVPRKAASSDADAGYDRLLALGSPLARRGTGLDRAQFEALRPQAKKLALLNIEAKLRETYLGSEPLISFVEGVRAVEVERLFLMMRAAVKGLVERSPEWAAAAGHRSPGRGLPDHPHSWKHRRYGAGNLQLCFAALPQAWPPSSGRICFSVDVDIDLERGIKHVGEWLDNHVFRPGKTDPSLVYALLFSQGILPLYRIAPRRA